MKDGYNDGNCGAHVEQRLKNKKKSIKTAIILMKRISSFCIRILGMEVDVLMNKNALRFSCRIVIASKISGKRQELIGRKKVS